ASCAGGAIAGSACGRRCGATIAGPGYESLQGRSGDVPGNRYGAEYGAAESIGRSGHPATPHGRQRVIDQGAGWRVGDFEASRDIASLRLSGSCTGDIEVAIRAVRSLDVSALRWNQI